MTIQATKATRKHEELDLQRAIVGSGGLAAIFGWDHVHFRPAMTRHGWRTAGSGTMAKGFPDLILVRGSRMIIAELKAEGGKPTPDQIRVLEAFMLTGVEVYIWRPSDLQRIAEILR